MCLTTKDPSLRIATENIVVYKYAKWRPFGARVSSKGFVYKMLCKPRRIDILPYSVYIDHFAVDEGYHSDAEPNWDSNSIFIIPKGATYVEGWFNDQTYRKNYVSDQLVYVGRRKNFITKVLLSLFFTNKK